MEWSSILPRSPLTIHVTIRRSLGKSRRDSCPQSPGLGTVLTWSPISVLEFPRSLRISSSRTFLVLTRFKRKREDKSIKRFVTIGHGCSVSIRGVFSNVNVHSFSGPISILITVLYPVIPLNMIENIFDRFIVGNEVCVCRVLLLLRYHAWKFPTSKSR